MKENQILSCIGFLAAAAMVVLLSACSPSDSAPYYLNKQDSSSQTGTETQSAQTPADPAPAPAAPAPAPPPVAPKAACTAVSGQSYPDGSVLYGYCRAIDVSGTLYCYDTISIAYYKCNDGKWIPQ